MTNKQIEHLISNWENARLDPIACVSSGDKLAEAIRYLQNYSDHVFNLLIKTNADNETLREEVYSGINLEINNG